MTDDILIRAIAFGPRVRRNARDTSVAAADAIASVTGKIALSVLRFASQSEPRGFTDDQLKIAFPDAPESSYRKRRTELAQRGYLYDTGGRRENRHGRDEVVWRITARGINEL